MQDIALMCVDGVCAYIFVLAVVSNIFSHYNNIKNENNEMLFLVLLLFVKFSNNFITILSVLAIVLSPAIIIAFTTVSVVYIV